MRVLLTGRKGQPASSRWSMRAALESRLPKVSIRGVRCSIERSWPFLLFLDLLGTLLAWYFRFCRATSELRVEGMEDLVADLKRGPVLLAVWHGRLPGAVLSWSSEFGVCVTLSDPSPIGRVGAAAMRRLGTRPVFMHTSAPSTSALKDVLQAIRDGKSLGIAPDGPKGPARQVNSATAVWIAKAAKPVHMVSWSLDKAYCLPTWDRFVFPFPFCRGVIIYRKFDVSRLGSAMALRRELEESLSLLEQEADEKVRRLSGRGLRGLRRNRPP